MYIWAFNYNSNDNYQVESAVNRGSDNLRGKGRLLSGSGLSDLSLSYSHNLFSICPQILVLYILNIHNLAICTSIITTLVQAYIHP